MLQARWNGMMKRINSTHDEPNTFSFKHIFVIKTSTSYSEMVDYAQKVFMARQLVKKQPKDVASLSPAEQEIIKQAGGLDKLKKKLGKTVPTCSTVIVTNEGGFLEMDGWVAKFGQDSNKNLLPVLNGAIISYDGKTQQTKSSTAKEVKVWIATDKDGKKNVYHFAGTGDDELAVQAQIEAEREVFGPDWKSDVKKVGFTEWEEEGEGVTMIPWWMFG
jgi:hypothetical protein